MQWNIALPAASLKMLKRGAVAVNIMGCITKQSFLGTSCPPPCSMELGGSLQPLCILTPTPTMLKMASTPENQRYQIPQPLATLLPPASPLPELLAVVDPLSSLKMSALW